MINVGAFLDTSTVHWGDLELSGLASTLPKWDFYPHTALSERAARLANVDIVITNKVPLDDLILRSATSLKYICVAATGYDAVDLAAAAARGIVVCNIKAYSTASVVQHTIGLMIDLVSRISGYAERVKQGEWERASQFCLQTYVTRELEHKVLGIIGYGTIGRGVAKVAQALGMTVKVAPKGAIDTILPEVDFLSLHCPLNAQTREIINKDTLALMKPGVCIINTSRGGLIHEAALADALRSGHVSAAALDVLSKEPPMPDNPLLASIPNVVITPHVAWSTQEARQRLLNALVRNVKSCLAGEPMNVVNVR